MSHPAMPQAQQLGRYHLLDRIAFGGMAEIFRAKTFDRDGHVHLVAVKRVLAHLIEDQDFIQMLVDEAKISALLFHENIARVYEFAKAGDEYFLAMEYVDGKDLRAILERGRQTGRPVPAEHVAWVTMEIAAALHAAHTQRDGANRALRIVHRDVSPSNVLCSYHGEVKLCDFGIAKATLTRVQTKTGVIKGKVKYMSPEQAMGRKLDHRSDLFSLGSVMYEMLTLGAPFQAPTEIELIFAVRDARKAPIRDVLPDVPDELARIVDRAMTRSRTHRYQSGEELSLDLRIFLDRFVPGYRRTNFSRYMRKIFEDEIEKELRQLEGYIINAADVSQTGINLIADVLGPDAPFTQFTPVFGAPPSESQLSAIGTGAFPAIEPISPRDLHGQKTMILDPLKLGIRGVMSVHGPDAITGETFVAAEPASPPPLHELETVILAAVAPRTIHEEETGEKDAPTTEGFHEPSTEELSDPRGSDSMPTVPRGPLDGPRPSSHERPAEPVRKIDDRETPDHTSQNPFAGGASPDSLAHALSDLHDRATMIFMMPVAPAKVSPPPPTEPPPLPEPSGDYAASPPTLPTSEHSPPAAPGPAPVPIPFLDESSLEDEMVPEGEDSAMAIGEEDLEPV